MRIGIIGISHKSASLPLREKLAIACELLFDNKNILPFQIPSVLLSTCNRTEIYFCADDLSIAHTQILHALRDKMDEDFEHHLYSFFGKDCFFHLACVTSGIDSALIGETEIQGQVKRAYLYACQKYSMPSDLHFLFQKALKIGKELRCHPFYTLEMVSLESILWKMIEPIFQGLLQKKILFVGLSQINAKMIKSFQRKGCKELFICNRTEEKAKEFSAQQNCKFLNWDKLNQWPHFDIVLFGTKSPYYLAHWNELLAPFSCKCVIDLSVPRNVDPQIGRHPQTTLLNIDKLHQAVSSRQKLKLQLAARLETTTIATLVSHQMGIFRQKTHKQTMIIS